MTGVSWRKTLLRCLAAIFAIILICIVIEGIAIRREIGEMTTAARIAVSGALAKFSNLEFGADDFKSLAYTDENLNIRNGEVYQRYLNYLHQIENKATSEGIYTYNSDIRAIVSQLRSSAEQYRSGSSNFCYTPMQFGYTYLDRKTVEDMFAEDMHEVVLANYHQDTDKGTNMYTLAFNGMDRVRLLGVDVTASQPILLYERDSDSTRSLQSVFGSTRDNILEMSGAHENALAEYDYVIAYDLVFTVHWEHETITPFFRNWQMVRDRIGKDYLNENGQLRITMNDITFSRRFILTN